MGGDILKPRTRRVSRIAGVLGTVIVVGVIVGNAYLIYDTFAKRRSVHQFLTAVHNADRLEVRTRFYEHGLKQAEIEIHLPEQVETAKSFFRGAEPVWSFEQAETAADARLAGGARINEFTLTAHAAGSSRTAHLGLQNVLVTERGGACWLENFSLASLFKWLSDSGLIDKDNDVRAEP